MKLFIIFDISSKPKNSVFVFYMVPEVLLSRLKMELPSLKTNHSESLSHLPNMPLMDDILNLGGKLQNY